MDNYDGLIGAMRSHALPGEGVEYLVRQKAADVIQELSEKLLVAEFYMRETQRKRQKADADSKHGKWIPDTDDVKWGNSTVRYRCSVCSRLAHFDKEAYKFLLSEFCPKCGADMRAAEGVGPYEEGET